jgi:beta-ureidopropionase / N-carbamoyl-L-amino-acid hydrolase
MASMELRIDRDRLWDTIQETAQWGAIPNSTGLCRLSCSDEDKAVREWFIKQTKELGCTLKEIEIIAKAVDW